MSKKKIREFEKLRGYNIGSKWADHGELWTFDSALLSEINELINFDKGIKFPSTRWQEEPVRFFNEVLGINPWSKQIEIIDAVRDNQRVAVASGNKIGKSNLACGLALWFYCSFDDARVAMTSRTMRQVESILWLELRKLFQRSGTCIKCKKEFAKKNEEAPRPCPHSAIIDGGIGERAATGLIAKNFREIKGFSGKEKEAVAGISGKNLLFIIDEASGVSKTIFEGIEGNMAGGAKMLMLSNPTKTDGDFFEAFHEHKEFFKLFQVSGEDTPNFKYGDSDPRAIPGLASRDWIDQKKKQWGEDNPLFKVHVKGEFATLEDGKIFTIDLLSSSISNWTSTPATGRLFVGLDPAGDGPSGDDTVWTLRRGQKILAIVAQKGLSAQAVLLQTIAICREHSEKREVPIVVCDVEGRIGAEFEGVMRAHLQTKKGEPDFQFVPVRVSDKAQKMPNVYDRLRDELAGNLFEWLKDGGAIVDDNKLIAELHSLEWYENQFNSKLKVTTKSDIKKIIGRSPDRYDSLALACYETIAIKDGTLERVSTIKDKIKNKIDVYSDPTVDPYKNY